jgi:hypothetical protein
LIENAQGALESLLNVAGLTHRSAAAMMAVMMMGSAAAAALARLRALGSLQRLH